MLKAQAVLPWLNHLLVESGWALGRLAPHRGRCLRIEAQYFGALNIVLGADGRLEEAPVDAAADLTLTLPADAVRQFLASGGEREALLAGARMQGPVEFAESLGFVLRNLHWDVEEDLSRLTGDIVARRLIAATKGAFASGGDAAVRLGAGIAESSLLVPRSEFRRWAESAGDLAARVDQLESRLRRLAP